MASDTRVGTILRVTDDIKNPSPDRRSKDWHNAVTMATKPDWYWRAEAAIEREDTACFDVAANVGQQFANVSHMEWFVRAVAEELGYIESEEA